MNRGFSAVAFALVAFPALAGAQSIGASVDKDLALRAPIVAINTGAMPSLGARQVSTAPPPNTGWFAPGKVYGFLMVGTLDANRRPDYSGCVSTSVGVFALTGETFISGDLLGGFNFTSNSADAGVDVAYNFGGASLGRMINVPSLKGIIIGGEAGGVVLFTKGVKTGAGLVFGLKAAF